MPVNDFSGKTLNFASLSFRAFSVLLYSLKRNKVFSANINIPTSVKRIYNSCGVGVRR